MQISIDGFVAGPQGQLDWMTPETDKRQVQYLQELTETIDLILLGRKMAEEAIPHWEKAAGAKNKTVDSEFAGIFVSTQKIVFSRTLNSMSGKNVSVERGDLDKSISALKKQPGKDLIVYGGGKFVSELIKNNLIDEYHLLVNPVALGEGKTIFSGKRKLKLVQSIAFNNGVVASQYANEF